jgi:LPS O-antigen subunit length determinant protein (WzzB/FepE family)
MNEKNTQEMQTNISSQSVYSGMTEQKDDLNWSAGFLELFAQWPWLIGITFAGTLLAVLYALITPKIYEIDARVVLPTKADVKILSVRGFEEVSQQDLFNRYYNKLRSADNFRNFLVENGWFNKFYPDTPATEDKKFTGIYKLFSTEVLEPKKRRNEPNDLPPSMIGINFLTKDEALGVKMVNDYIKYTDQYIIDSISKEGMALKNLEIESIEHQLIDLQKKAEMENVAHLVNLTEAYNIANAMGIKKPTTVEALAQGNEKLQAMVNVGNANKNILALLGTEYLSNEIEGLRNRAGSPQFIAQIPELKQHLANIKSEAGNHGFKSFVANDAYIEGFGGLMSRLTVLNQMTFDFNNVQSARFDKAAMINGKVVKPNKTLMVFIGFIVSAITAIFSVRIMNAVQKRRANT